MAQFQDSGTGADPIFDGVYCVSVRAPDRLLLHHTAISLSMGRQSYPSSVAPLSFSVCWRDSHCCFGCDAFGKKVPPKLLASSCKGLRKTCLAAGLLEWARDSVEKDVREEKCILTE